MSIRGVENEDSAALPAQQESSTTSPVEAGKGAQARDGSRIEDMLTDLTMDDFNGVENDEAVIEALTDSDSSDESHAPNLTHPKPGWAPSEEPEPKTTALPPHAIHAEYSRPGMADATDEYLTGWLARADEPFLVRSTVCIGGNADNIDELLAGLDGGVEPIEASPTTATEEHVHSTTTAVGFTTGPDPAEVGLRTPPESRSARKPTESVHKPTLTRPISVYRDAKFLRFLRDVVEAVDIGDHLDSLLKRYRFRNNLKSRAPEAPTGSGPLTAGDTPPVEELGLHLIPDSARGVVAPVRMRFTKSSRYSRPFKPWWHEDEIPELPPGARQFRAPAGWKYVSDKLLVTLRHVALEALAREAKASVFAIRVELSPVVDEEASKRERPITWLRERVTKHLKQDLGRAPPFHLVLAKGHSVLLCGEIAIASVDRAKACAALLKAGGWFGASDSKRYIRMYVAPDNGWVNVMVKDVRRTGSPICANRAVDLKAKGIYEKEWLGLLRC